MNGDFLNSKSQSAIRVFPPQLTRELLRGPPGPESSMRDGAVRLERDQHLVGVARQRRREL